VFQEAIDGLGGTVGRPWMIEERQDVIAASFHGLPQRPHFFKVGRDSALDLGSA